MVCEVSLRQILLVVLTKHYWVILVDLVSCKLLIVIKITLAKLVLLGIVFVCHLILYRNFVESTLLALINKGYSVSDEVLILLVLLHSFLNSLAGPVRVDILIDLNWCFVINAIQFWLLKVFELIIISMKSLLLKVSNWNVEVLSFWLLRH